MSNHQRGKSFQSRTAEKKRKEKRREGEGESKAVGMELLVGRLVTGLRMKSILTQ